MSLRMGFYYHIPAIVKDSRIFTPGYFGRFLDSLAEVCDQLIYFAHMPHLVDLPNMDYSLKAKNLTLVSMGPRVPAWKASLFSWP